MNTFSCVPILYAVVCVCSFPTFVFAQQTAVSPGIYADQEAPNVADLTAFPSYRLQQVYAAAEFAHLGPGPYVITRVDWRPGSEMTETIDYPSERFTMTFSTTSIDPSVDGDVFDFTFDNNIGSNLQTVFDGPTTLTTANSGPAEGPKAFDYGLNLQTPYSYDPADGNLLMDLTVLNGETPLLLDFAFAPTETTRFIWSGEFGLDSAVAAGPNDVAGGQSGGHIIQFTVVPEPSGSVLVWTVVLAFACHHRKR